jgi:hypothetical protein
MRSQGPRRFGARRLSAGVQPVLLLHIGEPVHNWKLGFGERRRAVRWIRTGTIFRGAATNLTTRSKLHRFLPRLDQRSENSPPERADSPAATIWRLATGPG